MVMVLGALTGLAIVMDPRVAADLDWTVHIALLDDPGDALAGRDPL
ncbi:hypothetical protein [Streptomyces sp. NPDC014006]